MHVEFIMSVGSYPHVYWFLVHFPFWVKFIKTSHTSQAFSLQAAVCTREFDDLPLPETVAKGQGTG